MTRLMIRCGVVLAGVLLSGCVSYPPYWYASRPAGPDVWKFSRNFSPDADYSVVVIVDEKISSQTRLSEAVVSHCESIMSRAALSQGWQVVSRSAADHLLREMRYQQSGYTREGALRVGRFLNANAVIWVKVESVNIVSRYSSVVVNGRVSLVHTGVATVSAQMLDVESAEVLGSAYATGSGRVTSRYDALPVVSMAIGRIADDLNRSIKNLPEGGDNVVAKSGNRKK